jgi:hypothetical protein
MALPYAASICWDSPAESELVSASSGRKERTKC